MFSSPPCHLEQRPAAAWRLIMHLSFDGFDGSRFTGSICPPNEPLYCFLTSSRRLNDVLYGNVWILVCLLKPRAAWSWFICCVHAGQEQDSHGLENWNVRKNKAQEDHKLKIIGFAVHFLIVKILSSRKAVVHLWTSRDGELSVYIRIRSSW